MMELLLWRWSTAAQVTSAVLIAGFFLALGPSVRRAEIRPWIQAWLANVVAMMVTVTFWFAQPESAAATFALRFGYFGAKSLFVVLIFLGALSFGRRGWDAGPASKRALVAVVAYALVAAFVARGIPAIGIVQSGVVTLLTGAGAVYLLRSDVPGAWGLVFGFGARAVLGAAETTAYAIQFVRGVEEGDAVSVFLAAHSTADTGAEWMIALGCVLVLYRTIQRELVDANEGLHRAQSRLQGLVDLDPLTGLRNRRALSGVMRRAYEAGATVMFFDLDDFKAINDTLGHAAGDRSLVAFARSLEAAFRPDDQILRFGGDEFVVVAPGARPEQVLERLRGLTTVLAGGDEPGLRFSSGHAYMPPGGDPDAALTAADEAMYRNKSERRPTE